MNNMLSMFEPFVAPEIEEAFSSLDLETNDSGYDDWGFHPDMAKYYFSIAHVISKYFRPQLYEIENIPAGRVLIVANHSGQLPFDGLVTAVSILLHSRPHRLVRSMAERWFPTLPFFNVAFSRSGVVLGDPVNCRNLLEADNAILVFPEGTRGLGKPFMDRYRLREFGRGFMRLALQTNTPIVPVGIVGAEESIISVGNLGPLAKLFGAPYFPLPALLPVLGPAAYLPMPTQFHIHFGEPMFFDGPFDDEDSVIENKVGAVEESIRELLRKGQHHRKSWF